jgi:hypothetical protein
MSDQTMRQLSAEALFTLNHLPYTPGHLHGITTKITSTWKLEIFSYVLNFIYNQQYIMKMTTYN